MNKQENYQGCLLIGGEEATTRDGKGYWVTVEPENAQSESARLFSEITFMSGTVISLKFGTRLSEEVTKELESITFAKARARLALGLFEKGREYRQEIYSNTLKNEPKQVDDEYVQKLILTGLLNIRKRNPTRYQGDSIDIVGLCLMLGISKDQYLFNASILIEEDFIREPDNIQMSFKNGHIFITSKGIKNLASLTDRIQEQISKEAESYDKSKETIHPEFEYDVTISFAGEDRKFARQLAEELKKHGIRVFYDEFETATLWGKNLYEYLSDIYQNKARACIMLLSKHYATKSWTNLERKNAQARAFRENLEYILPIRLDDTEIPGMLSTVAYLSVSDYTVEKIADLVVEKLYKSYK